MRRDYNDDNKTGVSVTVRLPAELTEKIDKYWREKGMSSRSHYIEAAAEYYLSTVMCNRCGARNPSGASHCAICGVAIGEYGKLKSKIEEQYASIKDYISSVVTPNYRYTQEQEKKVSSLFGDSCSMNNPLSSDKCLVLSLSYMWAELNEIEKLLEPILDSRYYEEEDEGSVQDYIEDYIEYNKGDDEDFKIPEDHIFWKLHNAYLTISGVSVDYDPKLSEKILFYSASEKELYLIQFDLDECHDSLKKAVKTLNKLSSYYTEILKK